MGKFLFSILLLSTATAADAQDPVNSNLSDDRAFELTTNTVHAFSCSAAANHANNFEDREKFIRFGFEQGKIFWNFVLETNDSFEQFERLSKSRRYFFIGSGDLSPDFELGRTLEFLRLATNNELDKQANENAENYNSPIVDDGSTLNIDERFVDTRRWYAGRMLSDEMCVRIYGLMS